MRSPYNPTAEDLRSWAYDGQEEAPAQDWDFILSTISYEDLFIELASDIDCPKSVFFLSLLYLIVGDAVRSEFRTKKKEEIETLLDKAQQAAPKHWIYLWIQRSRELLIHPEKFNYDDWCGGVLARADEA